MRTVRDLVPGDPAQIWRLADSYNRMAATCDARHTAATMLMVLKVPLPAVMEIMGWSDASIARRYMHVPKEFLAAIADQIEDLMWSQPVE